MPPQHQIWIDREWFVRVDSKGYPLGACAEGALGVIVQIENSGPERERRALKIPRATAESNRENAYICVLLEEESKVVWKVAAAPTADTECLMIKCGDNHRPLGGFTQLETSPYKSARDQHRCVILVAFEKDRPPRFASVRLPAPGARSTVQKSDVFPPDLYAELSRTLDLTTIQALAEHSASANHADIPYYQTSFVRPHTPTSELPANNTCGSLSSAVKPEAATPWYLALPSIQFPWASGTFQEAVTRGLHHNWSLEDTYGFLLRVLRGLKALHGLGCIHGDLRPANILSVGSLANPLSFRVSDYGSFNTVATIDAGQRVETGHTQIGPATANHRTSIFYSPERRAGNERETADVAVFLRNPTSDGQPDEYLLCLGWRNTLLADEPNKATGSRLKSEARRELLAIWEHLRESNPAPTHADELAPGDRLRVRDLIVTIKGSHQAGPLATRAPEHADLPATYLCFRCEPKYWRVLHEKISVCDLDDQAIEDETVISLARYTELPMWSAATDLYSVGVLALYSLFTRDTTLHPAQIEEQLALMVETLENTSYFRVFWGYLENFRAALEAPRDAAAMQDYLPRLNDLANDAVRRLLGSVPYMRRIAACFTNTADFLLFVHYVLGMMHRQHSVPSQPSPADPPSGPFCQSRTDSVSRGSATRAHDRLAILLRRLIRNGSAGFGEIVHVKEDVDPTANQTIELMTVRDELSRVQSQLTAQNSEFTSLSQNILTARETIASLTAKHQEADKARRDLETRFSGTAMTNQQLVAEAKLRHNELTKARSEAAETKKIADQLKKNLDDERQQHQQLARDRQQLALDRHNLAREREQLLQLSLQRPAEPVMLGASHPAETVEQQVRPESLIFTHKRRHTLVGALFMVLACGTYLLWPRPGPSEPTPQIAAAPPAITSPEPKQLVDPPKPPPAAPIEVIETREPPRESQPDPVPRPASERSPKSPKPRSPRTESPKSDKPPTPSPALSLPKPPDPDPTDRIADNHDKPAACDDSCTGMSFDEKAECCAKKAAERNPKPTRD